MIKKIFAFIFAVMLVLAFSITAFASSSVTSSQLTSSTIDLPGAFKKDQLTPLKYDITYEFDFAFRCDVRIVDEFYDNLKVFGIKVPTSEGERILSSIHGYDYDNCIIGLARGSDMSTSIYNYKTGMAISYQEVRNSHCIMTATLYNKVDTNNHLVLTANTGTNAKNYEMIMGTACITFTGVPFNSFVTQGMAYSPKGYFETPTFTGDIMPNFNYDTSTIPWTYFRPGSVSINTTSFYNIPSGTQFKFVAVDNFQKQYGIAKFTQYHSNYAKLGISDTLVVNQRDSDNYYYTEQYNYTSSTYNAISNKMYTCNMDDSTTGISLYREYRTVNDRLDVFENDNYMVVRDNTTYFGLYCNGYVDSRTGESNYGKNTLPWMLVAKNGVYYSEEGLEPPKMNVVLVLEPDTAFTLGSATDVGVYADKYYVTPSDTWDIGSRLYNFLIWICFEMPVLSPLLSTIFMLVDSVVNISDQLLIPFVSITGIFGVVILFRIVYYRAIKPFAKG